MPGGRPRGTTNLPIKHLRSLLHDHVGKAVRKIVKLMDHEDPNIQLRASQDILDRFYGKAKQSVDLNAQVDVNVYDAAFAAFTSALESTRPTTIEGFGSEVNLADFSETEPDDAEGQRLVQLADSSRKRVG